jgi:uncharacterized protein YjdB
LRRGTANITDVIDSWADYTVITGTGGYTPIAADISKFLTLGHFINNANSNAANNSRPIAGNSGESGFDNYRIADSSLDIGKLMKVFAPVTGVTLSPTTLSLVVGGDNTRTLTATVAPANATNKAVTWESSKPTVATVSNGVVTAVAVGTADITVTTADGGFSATCTVTVNPPTAVTGVDLNTNTLTLAVNGTETLIHTIKPPDATNIAVTWSTGDESIATVSNTGTVTARAAGTTTITVTTTDGNFKAECNVTVVVPVTGITLNKNTLTLTTGKSETLIPTIAPLNATNTAVTWESNNSAFADVDQTGKVTAIAAGTTTITVTTADGGKTASCNITVQLPATMDPLNITFNQIADEAQAIDENIVLSHSGNTERQITLETPSQYSRVEWFINGTSVSTANNFTLKAADFAALSNGKYFLTLEVIKGGKWYNTTVVFEVTN